MTSVYAIIVAAGSGSRFGGNLPKQFCLLDGRPVLMTTIDSMRRSCPDGTSIKVVLSEDMIDHWLRECKTYDFVTPEIVKGGDTRWHSVKNALDTINGDGIVLIHDGARPLVKNDVVERLIERAGQGDVVGVVPVIPVVDSLRMITDDGQSKSVDRSRYRAVQTPQCFLTDVLKKGYAAGYDPIMTDDASVIELNHLGKVAIVEGSVQTVKITSPGDMAIVESYIHG